jgi:hexosaminidase
MSYLVYCELLYPLGDWARQVMAVRNRFAQEHRLPLRKGQLDWKDAKTSPSTP